MKQTTRSPGVRNSSAGPRPLVGRGADTAHVSALTSRVEKELSRVEQLVYNQFAGISGDEMTSTQAAQLKLAMNKMASQLDMVSGVMKQHHEINMAIISNMKA